MNEHPALRHSSDGTGKASTAADPADISDNKRHDRGDIDGHSNGANDRESLESNVRDSFFSMNRADSDANSLGGGIGITGW